MTPLGPKDIEKLVKKYKKRVQNFELKEISERQELSPCWNLEWDLRKGDKQRRQLFLLDHAECHIMFRSGNFTECIFFDKYPEFNNPSRYGSKYKRKECRSSFYLETTSNFESSKSISKTKIGKSTLGKSETTSIQKTNTSEKKIKKKVRLNSQTSKYDEDKHRSEMEKINQHIGNFSIDSNEPLILNSENCDLPKSFRDEFNKMTIEYSLKIDKLRQEFNELTKETTSKRKCATEVQNRSVFKHGILEESTVEESDHEIDWEDTPYDVFAFVETRKLNIRAMLRIAHQESDDSSDDGIYKFDYNAIPIWDHRTHPNVYDFLRKVYLEVVRKELTINRWDWIYYIPIAFSSNNREFIKECIRKNCYNTVIEQSQLDQDHFKMQRIKKIDQFAKPKVIVTEAFIRRTLFWKIAKLLQSSSAQFSLPEWYVRTPNQIVYYFTEVLEIVQLKDGDFDETSKVTYNQLLECVELVCAELTKNSLNGVVDRVFEDETFQFWKRGETKLARKLLKLQDLQRIFKYCFLRYSDSLKKVTVDPRICSSLIVHNDIEHWLQSNSSENSHVSNSSNTAEPSTTSNNSEMYYNSDYQSDYTSTQPTLSTRSYYQSSYPSTSSTNNCSLPSTRAATSSASTSLHSSMYQSDYSSTNPTSSANPYYPSTTSTSGYSQVSSRTSTSHPTSTALTPSAYTYNPSTMSQSSNANSSTTIRLMPWIETVESTSRFSNEAIASEEQAVSSESDKEPTHYYN